MCIVIFILVIKKIHVNTERVYTAAAAIAADANELSDYRKIYSGNYVTIFLNLICSRVFKIAIIIL